MRKICEIIKTSSRRHSILVVVTAVFLAGITATGCSTGDDNQDRIRIATFEVDASPAIGEPLAYDPTRRVDMPLSARGIVITGNGEPVVLCAVDWIGIGKEPLEAWKVALAEAAGTSPDRVTIHALHQHDAPMADFSAYDILEEFGADPSGTRFDNREFVERTIQNSAAALSDAIANDLQTITHIGTGSGTVEKVASNRRLTGRDGTLELGRMSSAASNVEALRAPVGTIDPDVQLVSFWDGEEAVAVLSYYASHPQSYYRNGAANPDFPGIARADREAETGVPHIHFAGAGGNVAAGKWNDGSTQLRQILADRLSAGMATAWEQTELTTVSAGELEWQIEPVSLPPGEHLVLESIEQELAAEAAEGSVPQGAARQLSWLRRTLDGDTIDLTALRIGPARILHTPAELAVEYQLYARSLYPDDFVTNASYGDYDPGYISTEIQYHQGGYEASDRASRVAPGVEHVLLPAIRNVLEFEVFRPDPGELEGRGYRLERSALNYGYDGEFSWINGRAGVIPAGVSMNPINKPTVVMLAHQVDHNGPDIFRGLHYYRSRDLGLNWEGAYEESAFRRVSLDESPEHDRLASNVSPMYHTATGTLLGTGYAATYDENLMVSDPARHGHEVIYSTFDVSSQRWTEQNVFEMPAELDLSNVEISPGQRVDLDDGSLLLPVYYQNAAGRGHIRVVRGSFDGETLDYMDHGNALSAEADDLQEPSLARYDGYYYLSYRNGEEVFIARSDDGLTFDDPRPLASGQGGRASGESPDNDNLREQVDQSVNPAGDHARQKLVSHSGGLYLAHTVQEGGALTLSRINAENLQLLEETAQTVIPSHRGGRLDHLDVTEISEDETWIIATEWIEPKGVGDEYAGNNLIHIAKLKWVEPNEYSRYLSVSEK